MNFRATRILLGLMLAVAVPPAAGQTILDQVETPERVAPPTHQDSIALSRMTSGVMPPDGLLTIALGARQASTVLILDDLLERISQLDYFLQTEAMLRPWLAVRAELPWRTWSGGRDWVPASGAGLADGSWQVVAGGALWHDAWISGTLFGGGNLPLGKEQEGLAEGAFSPNAGAALSLRFWREAGVPELRLHLNLKRRWNSNEDSGYGMSDGGFEPWPSRYPSAAAMGGDADNDLTSVGIALEFRKATTSLWMEYTEDRFPASDFISTKEMYRGVTAGLRWGLSEGWALHAQYQVNLSIDDLATEWQPGFPELASSIAISRQFSIGGRDSDGDGIVDRRDECPDFAEDVDGFQDDDGCPDNDNDGDGVPDVIDRSPDHPEDLDGFKDSDGIPDPDNDGDGIPDYLDLCPDEAEDFDGHRDDDGCPDDFLDRDGDGIEDSKDACPDDAEDLDGFDDDDGCPELDNDLDGLPDDEDDCPDDAETYNGIDDDDGCPEEAESDS